MYIKCSLPKGLNRLWIGDIARHFVHMTCQR